MLVIVQTFKSTDRNIETRTRRPLRCRQSDVLRIRVKFTTSLSMFQHEQLFDAQPIEPALATLLRPVARNELRDVTSIARAQARNGRPERIVFLGCPRTSRDSGRHPNSFQVGLAARWGIWGHRDE
jgi:hypothetical protein